MSESIGKMKFGLADVYNYVLFDNPLSQGITSATKSLLKPLTKNSSSDAGTQIKIIQEPVPLWELASRQGPFLRIAALSGASAVALAAYGAHKKYPKDRIEELKPVYETANRIHFFHTLALLGVPLCRYPKVSSSFLLLGMITFCAPCYHYAFTGNNAYGKVVPVGGTLLILGWLSMAL